MKRIFLIKVTEEIEHFTDHWDSYKEKHYTKENIKEEDNIYQLELEVTEDEETGEKEEEIFKQLEQIVEGKIISFEIVEIE